MTLEMMQGLKDKYDLHHAIDLFIPPTLDNKVDGLVEAFLMYRIQLETGFHPPLNSFQRGLFYVYSLVASQLVVNVGRLVIAFQARCWEAKGSPDLVDTIDVVFATPLIVIHGSIPAPDLDPRVIPEPTFPNDPAISTSPVETRLASPLASDNMAPSNTTLEDPPVLPSPKDKGKSKVASPPISTTPLIIVVHNDQGVPLQSMMSQILMCLIKLKWIRTTFIIF
ncbi:hypothetical protein ACFE04_014042 [Oxalis oulophora]